MKVIYSAAFMCMFLLQADAQTRPEKKLQIIPREELRFFNGDSLKVPDSTFVRVEPFELRRHSKMPEYIANPDIDYKMRIYKPDSTIDYKILRKRY